MTDQLLHRSVAYEQCDVPPGVGLTEWRARQERSSRRAKLAGGVFAAVATLAPVFISVRGSRSR